MDYRSFHRWETESINQILREDESRSTEGQRAEFTFSRTSINTRLSPNLLVQQVTTQKLLGAAHTSSALVICCVIRIRRTVKFQCLSTTLSTKQPIHIRCSSNQSHSSVQSCLVEQSGCSHASHHQTSFESNTRIIQRATGTFQFSLKSSCPHCVGPSLLLPWNQA